MRESGGGMVARRAIPAAVRASAPCRTWYNARELTAWKDRHLAILPILIAPDRRLKKVSTAVAAVDDDVRRLMEDMLETMYAAPGIGLSAPQVGRLQRVIVADVARHDEEPQPVRMANPEIIGTSDEMLTYDEGCLSLPEHYAEIDRPDRVRISYIDHSNCRREEDFHGIMATCLQHEIDHLDGILFVDHLSAVRRGIILRKLKKEKRARAGKVGAHA